MNPHSKKPPSASPKVTKSKMAGDAVTRKRAPEVYRPQPVPKVLQRKSAQNQPMDHTQAERRPIAPPVYKPQPVPRVLQAKPAISPNIGTRLNAGHPALARQGTTIQRAENVNYSQTSIKATAGTLSATGNSGSAGQTRHWLDTSQNPEALRFLYFLEHKVQSKTLSGP